MITITHTGDFDSTKRFLKKVSNKDYLKILKKYGSIGVNALASATPTDTGRTASSWSYEIETNRSGASIYFKNSNINKGVPIAIILQYGHGTGTGGYVQGRDYINPAVQPIFDRIVEEAWREVTA